MRIAPIAIVPGQRYRQFDGREQEQVVTVARLDQDVMGLRQVIFETPAGREICAYAAQIEAAIAAGELFPADDHHELTVFAIQPDEMLAS